MSELYEGYLINDFEKPRKVQNIATREEKGCDNFCNCCGAASKFREYRYPVDNPGILVKSGTHCEEKRRGRIRNYHVKTSNGPITVEIITKMTPSEEERVRSDDY